MNVGMKGKESITCEVWKDTPIIFFVPLRLMRHCCCCFSKFAICYFKKTILKYTPSIETLNGCIQIGKRIENENIKSNLNMHLWVAVSLFFSMHVLTLHLFVPAIWVSSELKISHSFFSLFFLWIVNYDKYSK